jgi:rubredoxin-NAD+ reductase
MDPIVIVGTGLAGYNTARELRKLDGEVPLVIVSADGAGFYSKPMLSNALASGKSAQQLLIKSAAAMREELRATLIERASVTSFDPTAHHIRADTQDIAYSKLVLALGADPIRLPLAGDGAAAVMSVNDLDDYARFRTGIEAGRRITVLGAGLIGCEFANDLATAGYSVDVVDIAAQPLARLLPLEAAEGMRAALAALGVRWHLGRKASAVERRGAALVLCFDDGTQIESDGVLSAVGLTPRTTLARAAGLAVNRGIVVDHFLRSSDPDIHALGDCAEVKGQVLPFVMPIMHASRALASTLAGKDKVVAYPPMPVVVKTPALPTVVCPPTPGSTGSWRVEMQVGGAVARYVDGAGKLLGFALTGPACTLKSQLLKEMPPADFG